MENLRLRRVARGGLTPDELAAVRALLWAAFADSDPMTEGDWERVLVGEIFLAVIDDEIAGCASVAERELRVAGRPIRTGYVEGVAVAPGRQANGAGTRLMRAVGEYIAATFELGALGTGVHHFYERLGWRTWQGPSFARGPDGLHPTPDEDGYIMVLTTPQSPPLDFAAPIETDAHAGGDW